MKRAKERQEYVLGRMVRRGSSPRTRPTAKAQELVIRPRINQHINDAAYFTEQVRRYLEETYGDELLYRGGLEVHTSMNLEMQLAAQAAVQANLRDHDKRHGYRGPLAILTRSGGDRVPARAGRSLCRQAAAGRRPRRSRDQRLRSAEPASAYR